MVSWDSEVGADAVEGDNRNGRKTVLDPSPNTDNAGRALQPNFRSDLVPLARCCTTKEDYEALKGRILNPSLTPSGRDGDDPPDAGENEDEPEAQTTLMHATLSSKGWIPLDVIQCIIETGGSGLASVQDDDGMTPLHLATSEIPERTDIVQYLVHKAPDVVGMENQIHLRPIDLISHKIIMMEETLRYDMDSQEDVLDGMWETVHCLASASASDDYTLQQPLLHSCLVSNEFPFSLMRRAIKRYTNQLKISNQQGDLPLHLVVKRPPADSDAVDDVGDLFLQILREYTGAATVLNQKGLSPLAVAIENGHGWRSSVMRISLSETPASIGTLKVPPRVLPFLLERLVGERDNLTATFVLLRTGPPVQT